MNFIYKIYSGYDGFQPKRIPERLADRRYLSLGWKRYLDEVDVGNEVWVYFHGPHGFEPGVYIKGRVAAINPDAEEVRLRVYKYDTSSPLTDHRTSAHVAAIAGARGRQVFLFPKDWKTVSDCTVFSSADSCSQRRCDWCPTWKSLRRMRKGTFRLPPRLGNHVSAFIPAYWAIPPRCYLNSGTIKSSIHQATQILKAFKTGNQNLAYPLARAIFEAIHEYGLVPDFDCIVPIPLSQDKAARGEIHRTRLLAQELSELFGIPVRQLLKLSKGISKRRMLNSGYTYAEFERSYAGSLESEDPRQIAHVLLVDDVSTYGGTLNMASRALLAKKVDLKITTAVAVQMIVKSVVIEELSISK
ncbi:MAG TPA: hypothetical protein VMW50_02830 [Dehalococcoidia bacterium]|nr:hypothetical protein [Dehalococcoidia bacterium]